jgi:uncharacterized tellurite resistance protein B-like protein
MSLLRFLGLTPASNREVGDTATVRRIAAELEALEPATARYLAAFAFVLARVAHADLEISAGESAEIERSVSELAELSSAEAALVVEIAKSQARLLGGTENFIVTREFRQLATPEQRAHLLHCLFAVASADETISTTESAEIAAIADELGFTRPELNAIRAGYRDKLAELKR